ncbi:MAG: NAD-dependent epimerase/dehydratase family protein, partial [Trebonia sp.]
GDVSAPPTHLDHIIHAGMPGGRDAQLADPVARITVSTRTLTQLLRLARRHKAHLTFVSSIETTEHLDPLNLEFGYFIGQRAGEALCAAYRAEHEVRSSVVRLSHVYGPGMPLEDPRVHARIIRATVAGEPIVLRTDGRHERIYTYVADAAEAVLRVARSGGQREATEAFDVLDEKGRITIRELAHATLRAAGRTPAVAVRLGEGPIPIRPEPTTLNLLPMHQLGWKPSIELPDGLKRTIRWHQGRPESGTEAPDSG